MYVKQFLRSQVRVVGVSAIRAAPEGSLAANVRFSSTTTPGSNANNQNRSTSNILHDAKDSATREAQRVARDVKDAVGEAKTSGRDLYENTKSEIFSGAKVAVKSAGQKASQARNLADKASGAASDLANQALGAAPIVTGQSSSYTSRTGALLNESIDAEEDKFASSFSPSDGQARRSKSPLRPSDVRAAQAVQEANINDLVDELEDKVRNLDHVKNSIPKHRIAVRPQQQQQQNSTDNRRR